ncbi:MAG: primosomal protein N' [Deltaproteobacteria bacterium]|nr:primosomal protein N' [Deltaproteobacteria bacterium]
MADQFLIEVAISCPVTQTFSYQYHAPVQAGSRVRAPFGSRFMPGIVTDCRPYSASLKKHLPEKYKLKPIHEVIDSEPILSPALLELGTWLAQYYMHPPGEVFRAMTPAALSYRKTGRVRLTDKGQQVMQDQALIEGRLLTFVFQNRQAIEKGLSSTTFRKKCLDYKKSIQDTEKESFFPENQDLIRANLIQEEKSKNPVFRQIKDPESQNQEKKQKSQAVHDLPSRPLSSEQLHVVKTISREMKAPSRPFLLRGVTGSGKTEVWLSLIRILRQDTDNQKKQQALVLVPEISLTPQATRIFKERFPGEVAVVHSGMSDQKRWEQLELARAGKVTILIGPRSAIFAPFNKLKLIIVDEEHDNSYKQHQGFRYHARDVAVLRGRLEKALVVMGSATPSMESWFNAQNGRYHLCEMTKRVGTFCLPEVSLVSGQNIPPSVGQWINREGDLSPSPEPESLPLEIKEAIRQILQQKEQAIILVNKRGYAGYLFDPAKKAPVSCEACSVSLTLHKNRMMLMCHHCGFRISLKTLREKFPDRPLIAMGQGSQKTEAILQETFPAARIVRVDSDTTTKSDAIAGILEQFRDKQIDILAGTQMLAKGHDFPEVTLSVLLDTDQMLNLPDFRSGERVFQLIVQTAGRSGRGQKPGRFLLETREPQQELIQAAIQHDFVRFADKELLFRKTHEYPPYGKIILFELSATDPGKLDATCAKLTQNIREIRSQRSDLSYKLRVLGPYPPPIERVSKRYRRLILFSSALPDYKKLRELCALVRDQMPRASSDIRLSIDVDPQSLI